MQHQHLRQCHHNTNNNNDNSVGATTTTTKSKRILSSADLAFIRIADLAVDAADAGDVSVGRGLVPAVTALWTEGGCAVHQLLLGQ